MADDTRTFPSECATTVFGPGSAFSLRARNGAVSKAWRAFA